MSDNELNSEINRRRTFAIISHPDAGKTTLTEKLLLYGGAIHLAGSVKSRKAQRHAVSDWMEIEKQRGISVTSSVMQFDYDGYRINILDTPGHQDFSEDTYRTLMAVDSAVMIIDVAKGVETQTQKLFKVCKQRGIPIFTFVNKLDRFGKNPFELMEELEKVLEIRAYPMNWPIGVDGAYQGVYNRQLAQIELFDGAGSQGQKVLPSVVGSVGDPVFSEMLGSGVHQALCDDIELLDMAGDSFDLEKVRQGELTPMFFGSAMTNFGVRNFLEQFLRLAPAPAPRLSSAGLVQPADSKFSAFVFKIQANMNPAHRDRLAFIRICSGKFTRGMAVLHNQSGKLLKLAQPQQFLAQERTIIDEAYPGDIVGLFDPGVFGIGDTLHEQGQAFTFADFPVFPPEKFARVQAKDTMKRKQFVKGITQLTQEGAVQLFRQADAGMESYIVGTVGSLQFDVLEYRLKNEYGVDILMNHLPYELARWLVGAEVKPKSLRGADRGMFVYDVKERPVLLVSNEWALRWVADNNPAVEFFPTPAVRE
ncbi:peptide chain release factor 3|uniref:Peptide chain release factor 3 n=1 Tax=Dendrosporobacter quercicolus TaxID=146817 RepID=A0A1G9VYX1_9FIRM|nr:peptide chain release factor 3 [Dendrosporobacter quercicolus]NSL47763.1 peptide chain release factor 3 [Dendrosporobacter quercicolus DSM 1736]SDM77440.1 peptide chain release factor 3 [Dendrosporobacter quercicolus]